MVSFDGFADCAAASATALGQSGRGMLSVLDPVHTGRAPLINRGWTFYRGLSLSQG